MFRKLAITAALVLAAISADARTRSVGTGPAADAALSPISVPGTTVSGAVTAVNGNIISLAGGLVTIDASSAKITDDRGAAGSISSIATGAVIYAVLSTATVAPNAPLPASIIAVSRTAQVTLGGPVQTVGTNSFVVLGRTINVDANTSFGGLRVRGIADLLPNDVVQVQANASGGTLLATSVLAFAPVPKLPTVIHGTVKSIGTDSWVITDRAGKDWTIAVNAQTKIIGDPKVGDTVDILTNVDSANQYVAVSIIKSVVIQLFNLLGPVKSITASFWVIHEASSGKDVKVAVTADTKISGNPQVDDTVIVIGTVDGAGNYTASTIGRIGVDPLAIRGIVKEITHIVCVTTPCRSPWTIGPESGLGPDTRVLVDDSTTITGNPKVGDHVVVTAIPGASGLIAKSITKI